MGAWVVEAVMAGGPRAFERSRPFRIESAEGLPSWVAPVARGLIVGILILGVGMVVIDGTVRCGRSRNTPPATEIPSLVSGGG
jgi:hypothetical protein